LRIIKDYETARKELSRRVPQISFDVSSKIRQRLKALFGTEDPEQAVKQIIEKVRGKGDEALIDLTSKIDGIRLNSLEISREQITDAYGKVDEELVTALKAAASRIVEFHKKQKDNIYREIPLEDTGQVVRPLERVGVYVPGGTASYPSTVLMTAIPAKVAGVGEIVMVTPPKSSGEVPPATLVAADIAGVDRIFIVGGAQAVAALTYGTETIPKVDKICGPGNLFVMLAKKMVYGTVDIDGLQGPSEVVVIADDKANPAYCAADLLAQAEHDTMASVVLITTSSAFADKIIEEIEIQIENLSRKAISEESLRNATVVITSNIDEAIKLSNLYAPEHLCLMVENSSSYIEKVQHAGCIVVGEKATVVMGDYVAGPSHALPTSGTARFGSPLNIADFFKYINIINVNNGLLRSLGKSASIIARAEGLDAHALAVEKRIPSD